MDALHVDIRRALRAFTLDVDLAVGDETLALVGPSGAGKTTVLRAIAGLARPDEGTVVAGAERWFDSARRVDVPPERRSVGVVFQEYALFPHMTVEQNVAYGGRARTQELIASLGLGELARVRPADLSGGERQRVALARALARDPQILLLDEPLAALDSHTRAAVRAELKEHLRRYGLPTVLVTHDYADAAALSDRIAVMVDGRIVQVGTATELIASPASPFVANFIGSNVVHGRALPAAGGLTEVRLPEGDVLVSTDEAEGDVAVVVYPWEIAIARDLPVDSTQNHVRAPIRSLVPVGNRIRVRVGPLTAEITTTSADRLGLHVGDVVVASFKATGTRLFLLK